MKRSLHLLACCLSIAFCMVQCSPGASDADRGSGSKSGSPDTTAELKGKEVDVPNNELLILTENSMADIPLPFPRKEMLDEISAVFQEYEVTKEIGQQDGPNFPIYNVMDQQETVMFFAMNWEDTLKLDAIYIQSPIVIDQYGLSVGRNLNDIIELREGILKTQRDYHSHTYALFEGSHIIYEIEGDESLPDTTYTGESGEVETAEGDWTITKIIWR